MIRTAARLAAIAAVGLAAAPAANADAHHITMENVIVSSYQTSASPSKYDHKMGGGSFVAAPRQATRIALLLPAVQKVADASEQSPLLFPAVQKVREAAARCSCS